MSQPILCLERISKAYQGAKGFAVDSVSFGVESGHILALVGESGSGKTTLLRIIAGLEQPDAGTVKLSGFVVVSGKKSTPPNKRNIGLVFQDYALFPHLTLFGNIAFGLKGYTRKEQEHTVREMLAITGLEVDINKYPHQLSGGQQQRVALARALAPKPDILLLDEPFSNLDAILREQVREDMQQIIRQTGITAILVTHDTKDALCTADQIAVLHQGKLLQLDDAQTIYRKPKQAYVAQLFGKFNILDARQAGGQCITAYGAIDVANLQVGYATDMAVCFRPEQVQVADLPSQKDVLQGVVLSCMFAGDSWLVQLSPTQTDGKNTDTIHIHLDSAQGIAVGQRVRFRLTGFDFWNPTTG